MFGKHMYSHAHTQTDELTNYRAEHKFTMNMQTVFLCIVHTMGKLN